MTDPVEAALAERKKLYERACDAMRRGVAIRDPYGVSIRGELHCGTGVEIDSNVIFEGIVRLGDRVKVGPNCSFKNATVEADSRVNANSMIEDSTVGAGSLIGPYARLRPGSTLGESVQIGNYVEVKNSEIGAGSRINHLAFVGDARIGKAVTIGAGTITCNHNFVGNATTTIEDDAYIGSGCLLVAPLRIGKGATIAAGSTVTIDAPDGILTVARVRQQTVAKWKRPGGAKD